MTYPIGQVFKNSRTSRLNHENNLIESNYFFGETIRRDSVCLVNLINHSNRTSHKKRNQTTGLNLFTLSLFALAVTRSTTCLVSVQFLATSTYKKTAKRTSINLFNLASNNTRTIKLRRHSQINFNLFAITLFAKTIVRKSNCLLPIEFLALSQYKKIAYRNSALRLDLRNISNRKIGVVRDSEIVLDSETRSERTISRFRESLLILSLLTRSLNSNNTTTSIRAEMEIVLRVLSTMSLAISRNYQIEVTLRDP